MLENVEKHRRTLLPIPYEDEKIPDCCQIRSMPNKWVSDAMGEEFKYWCPTQPVMITAPTGKGKTTFVEEIVRFWRKVRPNQKVLLLVNRTAIATQQKRELTKTLGSLWGKVNDMRALELVDDFPDIGLTVKTYQAFAAQYRKMNLREYDWVIFDEAHYFLADSTFNQYLDQIFWKLPELFSHARRVYTTATPGTVVPCICDAEEDNLRSCRICRRCFDSFGKLKIYDFPSQFNQIQLFYYRKIEEIVNLIQGYPNDKFLIFTARREDDISSTDTAYTKALKKQGLSVDYLDSFSKNSDTWKSVCEKGTFESQVLVCTSVLDCGVSIHDDRLKHIIVETTDKTEFLQMVGRKRLKPAEKLNVYIRSVDRGKLYTRLRHIENKLRFIRDAEKKIKIGKEDSLIFRAWNDEEDERLYSHLLNYSGHGRISRKKTAYMYLRWQKGTIDRLFRDMEKWGDDSVLPRMAHEWLDQEGGYDRTHWLDYDEKAEARMLVLSLLESYVEKPLDKEEWKIFVSRFIELSAPIATFQHDNDRDLQCVAINHRLISLMLPYVAQKCGKTYKITRCMENTYEN